MKECACRTACLKFESHLKLSIWLSLCLCNPKTFSWMWRAEDSVKLSLLFWCFNLQCKLRGLLQQLLLQLLQLPSLFNPNASAGLTSCQPSLVNDPREFGSSKKRHACTQSRRNAADSNLTLLTSDLAQLSSWCCLQQVSSEVGNGQSCR